jgi:type I pantothenate kinase
MPPATQSESTFSPYIAFSHHEWARLRANTPLTLPLSRLLNLYVAATQGLHRAAGEFLGNSAAKVPFIMGIGGSVAVGKSTTARVLRELLARWPHHPKVDLVTTDGFLYPNRVLKARGLMHRKGFPESYDVKRLLQFVADVKSGVAEVSAPVYSHLHYDIVPGGAQIVRQPDIMILEGLNVLQTSAVPNRTKPPLFVSDFFDFAIYVDAKPSHIQSWYVERFLMLCRTAFRDPESYFHRYASLSEDEARVTAEQIWRDINEINLKENILPTRSRADLILAKDAEHAVRRVLLRKI